MVLSDGAMELINEVKAEKDAILRKVRNSDKHNKAYLEAELQRLTNKLWMVTGEAKVPSFLPYLQSILEEQNLARVQAESEADEKFDSMMQCNEEDLVGAATDVDMDLNAIAGSYLNEAKSDTEAPKNFTSFGVERGTFPCK